MLTKHELNRFKRQALFYEKLALVARRLPKDTLGNIHSGENNGAQ